MTNIWRFTQQNPAARSYITTGPNSCCKAEFVCRGCQEGWAGSSRLQWPSSPEQCQQHHGQTGLQRILLIANLHGMMGGKRRMCAHIHTYRVPQGDPRPSVSPSQPRPLLWVHFGFHRSFLFLIREKQSLRAFELQNSFCKQGTQRNRHDLQRSVSAPALSFQSKGPTPHLIPALLHHICSRVIIQCSTTDEKGEFIVFLVKHFYSKLVSTVSTLLAHSRCTVTTAHDIAQHQ